MRGGVSDKYIGSFVRGRRTGHGVWNAGDGTSYAGEFLDGRYAGRGTLTDAHGDGYAGTWASGWASGEDVTVRYACGDVYRGGMAVGK